MSQQNVEIVRHAFTATSGGDPTAVLRWFDPDIEWDMTAVHGWAEKRVYRGSEVRRFLQEWADSWHEWHFDVEDVRPAGDHRVFVAIHEWATGLESTASVDQHRYFAIDLDGGRITRVRMFSDRNEAFEAAGLPE